jgi:Domain of unknown function (DU1801)
MQPTGADVEEFLAELPHPQARDDAERLIALLSELTGEEPVLWSSGIIGLGSYRYRYPSGHEGTAPLGCFAVRKNNLVVYLVGGFEERYGSLLEKLGPHKSGKSCLYLKRLDDVDLDVLRELIRRSIQVQRGQDRAASKR